MEKMACSLSQRYWENDNQNLQREAGKNNHRQTRVPGKTQDITVCKHWKISNNIRELPMSSENLRTILKSRFFFVPVIDDQAKK